MNITRIGVHVIKFYYHLISVWCIFSDQQYPLDMQSGSEEPLDEKDMNGEMGVSQDDNQSHDNLQSRDDCYGPNVHVIKPIEPQGDVAVGTTAADRNRSPVPEPNELTLQNDKEVSQDLSGQTDHYQSLQEQDLPRQLPGDGSHITSTSSSPRQQSSPLEYHVTQKDQPVFAHSEMSPDLVTNQMERLQAIANYSTQGLFPEHFSLPVCTKPEAGRATL